MSAKPKIVDLFCGCGGFGLGAELAGFQTVAAVDIDETLQSAYRLNFPDTNVLTADLAKTGRKFWSEHLNGLQIDGVIGGPPCQGYSRMGTSDVDDPRRTLLGHFFRNVNIIKPKFFIMENVEGLLDEKNRSELDLALQILHKKYTILPPVVLDASDCGAPTKRRRVIVIGYNKKLMSPIDMNSINRVVIPKVTVQEAISDLASPVPQNKDPGDFGWGNYISSNGLSSYAKRMRAKPTDGLGWKVAKERLSNGLISGFFDTAHAASVMKRYGETPQGSIDKISRAKRLEWRGFCPTLRAGTGSDKGSHQAVRPIHPSAPRVITVREAARLQGFPDWFVFNPTKWHSFRMIGNSVSPLMSYHLLKGIYDSCIQERSELAA